MYTLVSAYGIELNPSANWKNYSDLAAVAGTEIAMRFRRLYLTLQITNTTAQVTIDLFKQAPEVLLDERALSVVFGAWDPTQVLTNEVQPTYKATKAKYFDLGYAGYRLDAVSEGGTVGSSTNVNDLTDVVISRPLTDMANFARRMLVNINGFFYPSEVFGQSLVVPQAAKSLRVKNRTLAGALSFEGIGDIQTVQIKDSDILSATPDRPLNEGLLLKLPAAAQGKTVMVVIGGYLHLTCWNQLMHYVNDNTLAVDIYRFRLEQRYAESHPFLDLGFQRPDGAESDANVDGTYLRSDTALRKLLTMPQSFFVIVDTPSLRTVTSALHSMQLPGRFFAYSEPVNPIMTGAGKLMNYWHRDEAGIWGVYGDVSDFLAPVDLIPRSSPVANLNFRWDIPYQPADATVLEIIADLPVA